MVRHSLLCGLVAIGFLMAPCRGAVIPFNQPKIDAMFGVKVHPTGPRFAPLARELFASPGSGFGYGASTALRYYSGNATFSEPINSLTMTLENESFANFKNYFTLVAFDKHHRVARKTVKLAPDGEETQITLSTPTIDQIKWFGQGWSFHAYVITKLDVTFVPAVSVSSPGPGTQVGSSAPEPGFVGVGGPSVSLLLLRRPRKREGRENFPGLSV